TFAPSVTDVPLDRRHEILRVAEDHGLEIVGLHWLLVSPKGLHVHTREAGLRARTVQYLRELVHFAGDLGAPVMIFGSPAQRRLEDGDRNGAWERTIDSFRQLLPDLEERDVVLCQEA